MRNFHIARASSSLLVLALTACAGTTPPPAVQIVPQRVTVEVQRPCGVTVPAKPTPLAKPLPTDAIGLAAVLGSKLLEYSGPGGFADRALTALNTCTKP